MQLPLSISLDCRLKKTSADAFTFCEYNTKPLFVTDMKIIKEDKNRIFILFLL